MQIDRDRLAELLPVLAEIVETNRIVLRQHGYEPGLAGCDKALQEIFQRLERQHPERRFPRTDTGRYKTSREAVAELAGTEPFLDALLKFKEAEKLRGSFLNKMSRAVVHASFDVLKTTGALLPSARSTSRTCRAMIGLDPASCPRRATSLSPPTTRRWRWPRWRR